MKKDLLGFRVVYILLILLVVAALSVLGVYVYRHNHVKPAVADTSSQTTATTKDNQTTPKADQSILKITELGIQLTVPDSIKDLTYETHEATLKNGTKATVALFSTKSLSNADAKCGPESAPLGSLLRTDGKYPSEKEDETNVLDYGQLLKQFTSFYVTVGHSQAGCSSEPAVQTSISTYKSAFESAQTTVEEVK